MLHVHEHVVNGAVAAYIVRNYDGEREATFVASDAGRTAAYELANRESAVRVAEASASQGWCQPDIRQDLMRSFGLSWVSADMVATEAVRADAAAQSSALTSRAA